MSSDIYDRLHQTQSASLQHIEIGSHSFTRYIRHNNAVALEAFDRLGGFHDGGSVPPAAHDFVMNLVQAALLTPRNVLELRGLDVSRVIKPVLLSPDWRCLGSLAIESCFAMNEALTLLACGKNQHGQPLLSEMKLHSLRIRHDANRTADRHFKAKLRDFIVSLQGLVNLSVLLESENQPAMDFKDILIKHGKSLRTLVLEERGLYGQPFKPLPEDRSHSWWQLQHVSQFCRHLVELGIALDWTELPRRVRSS